jgi:hypothetical protein
VIEVYPNGNLLVSGEKQVTINQGTEFIRFSGVVNPVNVTFTNTVSSTRVARCAHRISRQRLHQRSADHGLALARVHDHLALLTHRSNMKRIRESTLDRRDSGARARRLRTRMHSASKDLTQIQGVRSHQLVGYWLVVGLDGTGRLNHANAVHLRRACRTC